MKNYLQIKKRLLKRPEIKKEYEALGPEFEVIALLVKARTEKRWTQRELARKAGTKQSAISRLESGAYNPSLSFLYKVADALDARVKISLNPR